LKAAIDKAIWSSIDYEEFLQKMRLAGYEVRRGKNLAFRAPDQTNFTNMKSLGNYYTEDSIELRLERNRHRVKMPRNASRQVRLFIDMTTYVTTGNRAGFENWAKLNNLKEAAMTFNYLSENNLLNYDHFQQHITNMSGGIQAAEEQIVELTAEISKQKIIQKHCDTYRLCRKVVEEGKTAPNQKSYKAKHQAEYQLHDSLKKQLLEMGLTKIPSAKHQLEKIDTLEKKLTATKGELQGLRKQQRTLDIVQQNFEHLLIASNPSLAHNRDEGKSPEETL
jgi:hypothetical protein